MIYGNWLFLGGNSGIIGVPLENAMISGESVSRWFFPERFFFSPAPDDLRSQEMVVKQVRLVER